MVCDARVFVKPVKIHSEINIRIHAVFPSNWWFNVDQPKMYFRIFKTIILSVWEKNRSHAAYRWKSRKYRYTKNKRPISWTEHAHPKNTPRDKETLERKFTFHVTLFFCWWNRKIWIKNYLLNGTAKSCVILVDDWENEWILLANETIWCRLN